MIGNLKLEDVFGPEVIKALNHLCNKDCKHGFPEDFDESHINCLSKQKVKQALEKFDEIFAEWEGNPTGVWDYLKKELGLK